MALGIREVGDVGARSSELDEQRAGWFIIIWETFVPGFDFVLVHRKFLSFFLPMFYSVINDDDDMSRTSGSLIFTSGGCPCRTTRSIADMMMRAMFL